MERKIDFFSHKNVVEEMPSVPDENGKFKSYSSGSFSLTTKCNLDLCEYCYSRTETSKTPYMSFEDFKKALSWLQEVCDTPEVNFLGGEPLTHPEIIKFLDELALHKWKAHIYTNGFFEKSRCDMLVNHQGVKVICFHYDEMFVKKVPEYENRIFSNMEAFQSSTVESQLIFVINKPDFNYEAPFRLAKKYGLTLLWGFSAPTSGNTPFVGLETIRKMGPNLQEFLLKCKKAGIKTAAAFPFPLCMFEENFLRQYKDEFAFIYYCRPLIYFKPDLSTQFCSSIQNFLTRPLKNVEEVREFIRNNRETDAALKRRPTFSECTDCSYHLNAICQGACMRYKFYGNPDKMK